MSKQILSILLTLTILIGILSVIPITADSAEVDLADTGRMLYWPVCGHTELSQNFLQHGGEAIDINDANINGAEVRAAIGGTIVKIWDCPNNHMNPTVTDLYGVPYTEMDSCGGSGNGLLILGEDNRYYVYVHFQAGSIPSGLYQGAHVDGGQYIGRVGCTGNATGPHLHYQISTSSNWWAEGFVNPQEEPYIYDPTPLDYKDYKYGVRYDGTAVITKYTGSGGDITIPAYLGGYLVTSIGQFDNDGHTYGAFYGRTKLTSVNIPNSVTEIGESAFEYCTSLTSVTIPNSVTTIGNYAFSGCTGLTGVTIPNSVTTIGDDAFLACTSLTSVNIPNSVTTIGICTFSDCTSLTSVTIPNSVIYIGSNAFDSCTSLTSVTIPNSVTAIGLCAFDNCTSLTSVTIPSSVTYIGDYAFGYDWIGEKVDGFTIFGVEGSAAQTYANDNGFKFMKITEKTHGETGVIIYAPEDVSVNVEPINLTDAAITFIANHNPFIGAVVAAYDITMLLHDVITQPDAPVPVSIPCTNEKTKVYRQEEDGSLTDMHASYEDGYMVFYTDHFSTYILAVPGEETEPYILGDVDGDGDVSSIDATYIVRYSAQIDVQLDESALMRGDVDGNEELEIVDATYIQRYLAEFNIPYPIGEPI